MQKVEPGDDAELKAWTYSHYGGVILTRFGPRDFRIHRPNCDHIFWPAKGQRLAAQARYCFDTEDEARRWVQVEQRASLAECLDCWT